MSAAASARDHAAVFEIFSEMCEHYPEDPGAEAYDVLLQCASREGDPETALELIEAMCAARARAHGAHARAGGRRL